MKKLSWTKLILTGIGGFMFLAYAPKLAMDIPPIGKALCYSAARAGSADDGVIAKCLERYPAATIKGGLENLTGP